MELFQLVLYTISSAMFFSLLALGFGFTLRSVKFFNISYGGAFLVGGYVMFLFYRTLSIPLLPSFVLSLIGSGLYSSLSYQFIFKVLFERRAKNLVLLIASFGLLIATSATLGMIFGSQTMLIARHLTDIFTLDIFGTPLNIVQVLSIIFVPLIVVFFAYIRYKTRFGRATRAIEDDSDVAQLVGIPKNKTFLKIFFISGALAGLAGIIEGFDVGIIPSSGLVYILPTIVAVVVGGIQSFWGGLLGAFILAIAEQLTVYFFGGSWVQAIPFIILVIVLLVRPEGILRR